MLRCVDRPRPIRIDRSDFRRLCWSLVEFFKYWHPCQTVSTTALLCLEVSHHDQWWQGIVQEAQELVADSTVAECDRNHQWGKSAPCDRPRPTFGTPSASFLLRPLLVFSVVDCSLFCFVDLFHRWMSKDTVNILLTCGVFRAYNFWIQRRKTHNPRIHNGTGRSKHCRILGCNFFIWVAPSLFSELSAVSAKEKHLKKLKMMLQGVDENPWVTQRSRDVFRWEGTVFMKWLCSLLLDGTLTSKEWSIRKKKY